MSSVSEVIKFFLNKNWVVFALSVVAGFFTAIIIPADWRNAIPLDNNDWKTIALLVVGMAVFYVVFSGIAWLLKTIGKLRRKKKVKRDNEQAEMEAEKQEIRDYLTRSPDKLYWLVEHLISNGNPWTYVYLSDMYYEDEYINNTDWFKIDDAPEKRKVKVKNGEVRQEMVDTGRYKIKLHEWLYDKLKALKEETGSLGRTHRSKCPYKWKIAKEGKKESEAK